MTGGSAGDCAELATAALADGVLIRADPWFMSIVAAGGYTNRAIAQELYVTPKTVEVHLSSAYRKLGITSRGELVAMWPRDSAG